MNRTPALAAPRHAAHAHMQQPTASTTHPVRPLSRPPLASHAHPRHEDVPPRPHAHPHAPHARQHAWQRRLEAAHAALVRDLERIGDDEGRRRLRIEAHNDLVYRWSWEREVNPGPAGAARL
ncbi:unnamed protein product [Cutaneotrichosporon oleaginosum]